MTDVLVVGLPRSGSSWVGRMLGSVSGCGYVHEPDNEKIRMEAAWAKRSLHRFPQLVLGDEHSPYSTLWHWAFFKTSISRAINRAYLETPWREQAASGAPPRVIATIGRLSIACSLPRTSQHRVVKSVHVPLAAEWVASRTGASVVVILRDPRDIVASSIDLKLQDRDRRLDDDLLFLGNPPSEQSDVTRAAWQCALLQSRLVQAVNRNPDWIVIHHEDLVAEPDMFGDIARETRLPWAKTDQRRVALSNRPGNDFNTQREWASLQGRWRRTLSEEEGQVVTEISSQFDLKFLHRDS